MSNEIPFFLIIDSDEQYLSYMNNLIQSIGCNCVCAHSAEEGLTLIKEIEGEKKFDVIFTDVTLSNMGGLELINVLMKTSETASIPKVIISSLDKYNEILEGYRIGADYYMIKPIDNNQLVYALDLIFQNQTQQQDRHRLQEA